MVGFSLYYAVYVIINGNAIIIHHRKIPTVPSPKDFGLILSGFGIETQHRRIAFATSRIFELTPKLEPFEKNLTVNVITSNM